jgi:uncharacterized protein YbcV (DUF1398 family)
VVALAGIIKDRYDTDIQKKKRRYFRIRQGYNFDNSKKQNLVQLFFTGIGQSMERYRF